MKQTRTTLKELTAMYRAVLRHGILCNAIALGLIATAPAMAVDIELSGIQFATTEGLNIGQAGDTVTITSTGDGLRAISTGTGVNAQSKFADITADTINITSTSTGGDAGVWIQNNTTPADGADTFSTVNLTATDVNISAPNSIGVTVFSEGRLNIVGNTTITGKDAILTRGDAKVYINKDTDANKTVLNGDINFNYNKATSGTGVNADVNINLVGAQSSWTGNTLVSWDDEKPEVAKLAVDNATINLKNGAKWTATTVDRTKGELATNGSMYTALNNLNVDSGSVIVQDVNGIEIENLTVGANGLTVSGGEMTVSNSLTSTGRTVVNSGAALTINSDANARFTDGTATSSGGAIYNAGTLTVGGDFDGNSSVYGGAIDNRGTLTVSDGTTFSNNSAPTAGGAIANTGNLTIGNNVKFDGNTSFYVDEQSFPSEMGGGIYSEGTSSAQRTVAIGNNVEFTNNQAYNGGAMYFFGNNNVTIGDNLLVESNLNYAHGTGWNEGASGGINITDRSNGKTTLTIGDDAIFRNNTNRLGVYGGVDDGGAIHINNADNNVTIGENATFEGNIGSAIYNTGNITIGSGALFKNNVGGWAGAIYNDSWKGGILNLNATTADITFEGNKNKYVSADSYEANDIYNTGVVNLNTASGKKISLTGGIDGTTNGTTTGLLNVAGVGTIEIANSLKNQTVALNGGELHLNNADLTGSTVNVASGATINTIDDLINDYSSTITLASGAGIKGDIDFINSSADKYAATSGATVNYKVGNLISNVGKGAKTIQVVSDGATVDISQAVWTSENGATFASSGAADGMIKVQGFDGGIATAADASATVNEINYQLTTDESLNTAKSLQHTFVLNGAGTESTDNGLELAAADLTVADGATVEINDLKLSGTGTLNNAATGVLYINDSLLGVNVRNAGILYSDPTTYSETLTNTGVANISGDTFASTGVLENYNVANLSNDGSDQVTFASGATITGTGTTNLVAGQTIFNNTANTNTIKVASGADFTGTLTGGTLDLHNGAIDTIAGTFGGGNVVLDAKLGTTNSADSFTAGANANITEINILGTEYGTADNVTLIVGGKLDENVQINGMNYYTSVVDNDDGTITFSDKLINRSALTTTLADYATTSAMNTALATKQGTLTAGDGIGITSDTISVKSTGTALDFNGSGELYVKTDGTTIESGTSGLNVKAGSIGATQLDSTVNASLALADSALQSTSALNGANLTDSSVTLAKLATIDLSQFDNSTSGFITKDVADLTNYTTTTNMNTALAAKANTADLATVATSGKASDLTFDATHRVVTDDQITAWTAKQDALSGTNKLNTAYIDWSDAQSAALASGIDATKVGQIATNATNIATINTKIGTTDISSVGSTLTAAIAKNASDISTINIGISGLTGNITVESSEATTTNHLTAGTDLAGNVVSVANALATAESNIGGLQTEVGTAQTTAATAGLLSGQKIGDDVNLVSAINTVATTAAGTASNNTFTGTNTFEEQIVAEKGVKFGSDYSINENGVATLASVTAANGFSVDANNTLTSSGLTASAATIAGALEVVGDTTLTGALNANGGVATTTLSTTGDATIGGSLKFAGDATANAIDNGAAAQTTGSATTLATTATVLKSAENADYTGTKVTGSSAGTLSGALNDTNAQVNTNTGDIAKIVNGTTIVAKAYGDEDGNNIKTTYATKAEVTDGVTAVYNQAHDWAESLLGVDVDENVNNQLQNALTSKDVIGSTTTTIADALSNLDAGVKGTQNRLDNHDAAFVTLAAGEGTTGSVKNTVKTNAENATFTNNGNVTSLGSAATVGSALNQLGGVVDGNTAAIATLNGTGDGSVAQAAANAVAEANTYTDTQLSLARVATLADANAYTDRRIESLDKDLSAGVAGAVALSSVAVSGVERGEVSVGAGYGYFNGQSAAAFGAAMGLSDRWSVNAGAGISNADVSFRAGTNYKFKLF